MLLGGQNYPEQPHIIAEWSHIEA